MEAGSSVKARASVKTRRPMESAAMGVTVTEITMMEPLMTELIAMRDKGVMVEECPSTMPVISPVAPAPPNSSEVADAKSNSKAKADAAPKNPGNGIPAWIGNNWVAVHEPRIIGWDVDHFWIGRFNDDRAALRGHLLLFVAVQTAGVMGLLAQELHRICNILRLVDIGLAERRGPGE